MTPVTPSHEAIPALSPSQRFAERLQQLSEVTETLTYRLLELEERLAAGERDLVELRQRAELEAEPAQAMDGWLEETEDRLARVEELLRGGVSRSAATPMAPGRPLMAVASPSGRLELNGAEEADGFGAEHDPFPEDEEQPFLDEQSA